MQSELAVVSGAAPAAGPAPWPQLEESATLEAFASEWLAVQCALLGASQGLLVLAGEAQDDFAPVARWPAGPSGRARPALAPIAERTLEEGRGLALRLDDAADAYGVSHPLWIDGELHGVAAVEIAPHSQQQLETALRQLQWGAYGLEAGLRRHRPARFEAERARLEAALDLLATAVDEERFAAAAKALVVRLATRLACERVSLGCVARGRARVVALSHSALFAEQSNLVRAIEAAMDEALDQRAVVEHPSDADVSASEQRAHAKLAELHGAGAILTLPLDGGESFQGALLLERPAGAGFDAASRELCETAAAVLAPILGAKHANDRWIGRKLAGSGLDAWRKLVGPRHAAHKLAAVLVAGLAAFLIFARADYRVTATAVLEGSVQRVVVAPFDAYIATAEYRAGDVVEAGSELARLDDRDLRLERLQWTSERLQLQRQHDDAVARRDRAQSNILSAQIEQANAEIALFDERLARTRILAPFDGILVSGDLSQSLGSTVQRGDVLFEVAPLDEYRVILQVDERDIDAVAEDAAGVLAPTSLPDVRLSLRVRKITPVSTARDGRNYFRVEAQLDEVTPRLRPGMEGVGKVEAGRRRLAWIWGHELVDWLRLRLWAWGP